MNAERVTNKRLNRNGWYWAVKFADPADADDLIATLPLGTKGYYRAKGHTARPHWVLVKNTFGVEE